MGTTDLKDRLNGKLQARQSEPTKGKVIAMTETTALAPVESGFIALTNNALEIISENLKNQPLSFQLFDVIKSPSGGTTAFTVPGLAGDAMKNGKLILKHIQQLCA